METTGITTAACLRTAAFLIYYSRILIAAHKVLGEL